MATKLNFLQYTYRIRINHKTLYSQTFPGPHFGSWTMLESWIDTLQKSKSIQSWQFPLPYKYDIISEPMRCLATEGTWQWGSCIQIWCTGCISPIHHLNVSPGANFVDPVQEKADKNPYGHKASWWHCALLMHLLEPRTVLSCLHHDVK